MRFVHALAVAVCATSTSPACGGSAGGTNVTPPSGPFPSPLTVAPGLTIKYFAKVPGARVMTMGPDGAVYVSVPSAGRVVRVWDANGDNIADSSRIVASGLDGPSGLAFHKGFLYIANTNGVVRVQLDAHGIATGSPVAVNSLPGSSGHSTRMIVFGADSAMYVSVGSSCNLCVETDSERAAVLRFNEDGSNGRVFARGLHNAVGLAVHPTTQALWVSQNERDDITRWGRPGDVEIYKDGSVLISDDQSGSLYRVAP